MLLEIVYRDDVGPKPDRVLGRGELLAMPLSQAESLWVESGFPTNGPPVLGKVSFMLDKSQLPSNMGIFPIGSDGKVDIIPIDEKKMLLCLANDGPVDVLGPPYQINGCVEFNPLQKERTIVVDRSGLGLAL